MSIFDATLMLYSKESIVIIADICSCITPEQRENTEFALANEYFRCRYGVLQQRDK